MDFFSNPQKYFISWNNVLFEQEQPTHTLRESTDFGSQSSATVHDSRKQLGPSHTINVAAQWMTTKQ